MRYEGEVLTFKKYIDIKNLIEFSQLKKEQREIFQFLGSKFPYGAIVKIVDAQTLNSKQSSYSYIKGNELQIIPCDCSKGMDIFSYHGRFKVSAYGLHKNVEIYFKFINELIYNEVINIQKDTLFYGEQLKKIGLLYEKIADLPVANILDDIKGGLYENK